MREKDSHYLNCNGIQTYSLNFKPPTRASRLLSSDSLLNPQPFKFFESSSSWEVTSSTEIAPDLPQNNGD